MAAVGPFKATLSYSWDGNTGDSSHQLDVPVEAAIVRYSNENEIRLNIDVGSLASKPDDNEDGGNDAKKKKTSPAPPPLPPPAAAKSPAATPRRNPRRRCSVETAVGLRGASAYSTPAAVKSRVTRTPDRSTDDGPVDLAAAVRLPRAAKMNSRSSTSASASGRVTRSNAKTRPSAIGPSPNALRAAIAKPKGRSSSKKKVGYAFDTSASARDDVVKDSKQVDSKTPVWMLLLSRSGIDNVTNASNTSTGATDQTVLAAYRILGNPPQPDELHSQRQTKGSRPSYQSFCLKSSGSDGACVSFAPFTPTDDVLHVAFRRDSRVATRRVGTRGQPETSVCLVQSYEPSIPSVALVARAGLKRKGGRANHSGSSSSINISSIRFQTLVESQLFQSSLVSASRLDACSTLGSVAPAGGGNMSCDDDEMKRFDEERERATSLAGDMLTATVIASYSRRVTSNKGRGDEGDGAEASSMKRGASTATATDLSITASGCDALVATEGDDDFLFVTPGDVDQISDYIFLLAAQAKRGVFNSLDLKNGHRKRSTMAGALGIGSLGIRCRHCGGKSSGSYFSSSVTNVNSALTNLHGHLMKCEHCPGQTKQAVERAKSRQWKQSDGLKGQPEGRRRLFERIIDASFTGGDAASRAVVAAHLEKVVATSLAPKKGEETGEKKKSIAELTSTSFADRGGDCDAVAAIVDGADAKGANLRDNSAESSPLEKATFSLGRGESSAYPGTPPIMSKTTIESMVSPVRRSESKQTVNQSAPDPEGIDIDLDQLFEALDADANDSDDGAAKDCNGSTDPSNCGALNTSEGGSRGQSSSTMLTTPRSRHVEDADDVSVAGMTPIPITTGSVRNSRDGEAYVLDDITTPTRNFLTKLFGAESAGLTPFSLLKGPPTDSD
mmetsp:Transcript_24127/g.52251  ORF Transcript_24127/g.52251 Transcript_24127/m.52251 type:complete len:898 (-) Transcript_24127:28-2721(-)|eukprot:CAMPEP_0178635288 /NCGR_PEP_ID=MMETSP0698-20121128/13085_1 /TAXON_ID=265572 /ORGANISM="Extubocellulus spinifer, Strain CCMP396" /LENGTH=897 /DNA_ID=CAMNT_0020275015 /DNA_START=532 /DNA_END=3225 /DNA_ORIENTATION=-